VSDDLTSVSISYIKSAQFRVVHMDGALGGITPTGNIHLAVYSERPAIPQVVVYGVANGALGDPISQEGRAGVVRELEADLMMSRAAAEGLRNWLDEQIQQLDAVFNRDSTGA